MRPLVKSRRALYIIAALSAAVFVVFMLRPRNDLVQYVTDEIAGAGIRVSMLIPQGWASLREPPYAGLDPNPIILAPPSQPSQIGEFISRVTRIAPERRAEIRIYLRRTPPYRKGAQPILRSWVTAGPRLHVADAVLPAGNVGEISVQYLRNDSAAFAATSQRILRSIRVMQ